MTSTVLPTAARGVIDGLVYLSSNSYGSACCLFRTQQIVTCAHAQLGCVACIIDISSEISHYNILVYLVLLAPCPTTQNDPLRSPPLVFKDPRNALEHSHTMSSCLILARHQDLLQDLLWLPPHHFDCGPYHLYLISRLLLVLVQILIAF